MSVLDKKVEFLKLWKKFIEGTKWVNKQMTCGKNVDFEKARFEEEVIDPMDKIWQELDEDFRKVFFSQGA